MTGHLGTADFERYRSKAITAEEVRAVEGHLSACEQCRRTFMNSEAVDSAYEIVRHCLRPRANSVEPHLEYDELSAYVDGHLDAIARDIVDDHIKNCPDCDNDVVRMMSLRDAVLSDREPVTSAVPFWQKTGFRLGVEAAAILLLISFAGWFSIRQIQSLRAENEQLWRSVKESESTIADLKKRIDSLEPAGARRPMSTEREVALEIKDGEGLVTIDAEGNLQGLESSPLEYREAVRNLLRTGSVTTPAVIKQLRGSREIVMNRNADEPGFSLSTPVGVVLETARPTFHWTRFPDSVDYEVSVSDVKGALVQKAKVSSTSWQSPKPLARGRVYQWQVRAITKEGREIKSPSVGQPDAKFSVLDRITFDEIQNARIAYSSHLLLGTIYARAGLIDDAKREFRSLVEANPESSITRRILDGLNRL